MMVNQADRATDRRTVKRRVTVELPASLVMRVDEHARSHGSTATGWFRDVMLQAVQSLPVSQAERNMQLL